MKNNEGKAFVTVIIILVLVIIAGFVAYRLATGTDGIITKFTKDEEKYDKSEVLEEINFIITQKYLEAYSKATANGENKIEEFYNTDKAIAYLKGYPIKDDGSVNLEEEPTETKYIEDLDGHDDCYYVIIKNFKRDITRYGNGENDKAGTDYFFIKVDGDKYMLYYQDSNEEPEEIGILKFEQEI